MLFSMWLPQVSNHISWSNSFSALGQPNHSRFTEGTLSFANRSFSQCPPLNANESQSFYEFPCRNSLQLPPILKSGMLLHPAGRQTVVCVSDFEHSYRSFNLYMRSPHRWLMSKKKEFASVSPIFNRPISLQRNLS